MKYLLVIVSLLSVPLCVADNLIDVGKNRRLVHQDRIEVLSNRNDGLVLTAGGVSSGGGILNYVNTLESGELVFSSKDGVFRAFPEDLTNSELAQLENSYYSQLEVTH